LPSLFPPEPALAPFRPGLIFSFFNALTWQIATGTPLILLLEQLGASSAQTGLAYSFVFLLTPVQIVSTALLPRLGYKKLTLAGWGRRAYALLVPLGLAALAPFYGAQPWMVLALIGSCFVFCLLRAMGMAASLPWFFAILPAEHRGRYFGSDHLFGGIACMLTLIVCAALFWLLPPYAALFIQFAIALLGSALSYRALRALPDGPPVLAFRLRELGPRLRRLAVAAAPYRSFLLVTLGCYAVTTPIAPFAAYHLKTAAGLSPALIMLFELLRYSGSALGAWVLRRRIDRAGARPYLVVGLVLYVGLSLYWLALLRHDFGGRGGLIAAYALMGFASTCWMIGNLSYLPKLLAEDDRTLGITLQGALAALAGGLATTAWGLALRPEEGGTGLDATLFQALFAAALLGCAGLALVVFRLPEPDAPGLEPILPGSALLRPHRAVSYLINLVDPR
jgi:MFS family permease